ncbi:lantibiotic dehydratase [Caldalkalibacillus mannanilyticus]|uniref:lantibiotic dehydratase n=1 Tax=Caldalkalibacillus mannanilyticus TaxID=1418 RepID=UPI000468AD98|nr:lantibiotic dehydratase [Caldalkalibacillus mannanilyticus]
MRQYQTEIGMGRGAAKMKTLTSPIVLVRKTALSAWYCYKFGSKDLHTNLIILEEIRSRLAEKKEEVVEHIETKVKQADSDKDRKTLINLKRDIFNLRQKCINSIEEHLGTLKKYDLDHVVESFKAHYMELLTKESEVNFQYEQLYHHERNHIVSTYKNNVELFKALKFIHPTIMDKSRNYFSKPVEEHNAKLRKLDSTLAKVLTRAAHKTSPFSTLTYVGVGYWSQKSAPEEGGANVNTHYTVTRFNQAYILRAFEKMLTYPEFQKKATFGFVDTLVLYEGKFYWTILIDQPEIRKKVYKTVDSMITVNAAPSLVSFYHKFTYKKNFTLDEVFSFFREVGYPEEKIYELFKNLFDRQFIVPAVYLHQQSDCIIEECIRVIEELGVEGERVEYILAVLKKIKEELMIFDRLDNIEQYESFKRIEHQFLDLSKYLELDHITGKEVLYQDALMTEKEIFQPSNWEQVNESLLAYQQFTKLFDVAARFQLIMGEAFYKQFGNRRVKVSEYEEQILDVILNEVINRKDLWALSIEQDNEQYESMK